MRLSFLTNDLNFVQFDQANKKSYNQNTGSGVLAIFMEFWP